MTTRASATLVSPTSAVSFGAVPRGVTLSERDFLALVRRAQTEAGELLPASAMSWPISPGLGAPYSYLSASAPDAIASFTRDLHFEAPVIEVEIELLPWGARSKPWAESIEWNAVMFSAVSLHGGKDLRLTGLARTESAR